MIRKKIRAAAEWCEYGLRGMCGRITPDKRVIVIVTMFLVFAGASIYVTAYSIFSYGKGTGEKLQIRHIEQLQLELRRTQERLDSLNQVNDFDYEYEPESAESE